VDDESLIRAMMAEAFSDAGFEIAEAASGEQAAPMVDADGFSSCC